MIGDVLTGCVSYNRPYALDDQSALVLKATPTLGALLNTYLTFGRDSEGARNEIIRRLMLLDDGYFLRYTLTLYNGRAYADATSEIVNTSLTLAATAVAPAQAAKVLTSHWL